MLLTASPLAWSRASNAGKSWRNLADAVEPESSRHQAPSSYGPATTLDLSMGGISGVMA
jgi:hypothetical protein